MPAKSREATTEERVERRRRMMNGTIAIATIESVSGQPFDSRSALRECLIPGTEIQRYGRVWHMARFDEAGGFLYGRIGYEELGSTEELWNPRINDFEERQTLLGATSSFAIALSTFRMAFQLRSDRIRPQTFMGNLQALINEIGGKTYRWRVSPDVASITWDRWIKSVDRITEIRLRIARPNPNWAGRPHLQQLVEGANAKLIELVVTARKDSAQGVDVTEEMIAEAIEHAGMEYGSYKAKGEREETKKKVTTTKYDSNIDGVPQQREVPVDPETGEVSRDTLRRELQKKPPPEPGKKQ